MTAPALLVTVVRADGTPVITRVIGSDGGWIGRAAGCEILLPDPDRHVSARHCRIDFADDSYWITDRSTNGTFLNGSALPLPRGERQPLAAGDRLRVGTFLVATAQPATDTARADLAAIAATAGDAPTAPLLDPPWALRDPGRDATMAPLPSFATGSIPTPVATPAPAPAGTASGSADALSALLTDLLAEPSPAAAPPGSAPPGSAQPSFSPAAPPPTVAFAASPSPGNTQPRFDQAPMDLASFGPLEPAPMSPTAAVPPSPTALPANAVDDLVSALASDIGGAGDDLRAGALAQPLGGGALEVLPPERSGAAATRALAAFWCGLGIMPSGLDSAGLSAVMLELGTALRESVDGFADLLGRVGPDDKDAGNPFAEGHSGLRRMIERRAAGAPRVDDLMRGAFAVAAEREDAYVAAVATSVRQALRGMTPSALETRFGSLLQSRRQTARRAELMALLLKMEAELIELAEAQFRRELNGLMQQRVRRRMTFENGGSNR